jgi:hypothetical protein
MRKRGTQLEFLYRIDGTGEFNAPLNEDSKKFLQNEKYIYELRCLSITNGTWLATDMSTFVVRIKEQENQDELVRFGKHISKISERDLEILAEQFRQQERFESSKT